MHALAVAAQIRGSEGFESRGGSPDRRILIHKIAQCDALSRFLKEMLVIWLRGNHNNLD
jgi:hypothetical protein